jgi:hypothetical protein
LNFADKKLEVECRLESSGKRLKLRDFFLKHVDGGMNEDDKKKPMW